MPVIINFKVCDNAEVCNAINVCPTGAFNWNKEKFIFRLFPILGPSMYSFHKNWH